MAEMSLLAGTICRMRPALKAGLRPLWRDRDTLQIGVDPRRARALTGLGKAAAIVSLLDGSRDTAEVARTAATYGIGQGAVDKVLGLLASAGVLDDFPARLPPTLPGYLLERITPELACAALAYGHGDGGASVLARRRAAFTRVYGAGRVGGLRRDVPRGVRRRVGELRGHRHPRPPLISSPAASA